MGGDFYSEYLQKIL